MRTLGGLLAAGCIALTAAAGGCGGDDDGGEEERVEGRGYSYAVPDDWRDVSDEAEDEEDLQVLGVGPDTLVIADREDGFATNVNVIRETRLPGGLTASQYTQAVVTALRDPVAAGFPPDAVEVIENLNARAISERRAVELGGEEAFAWDYTSTQEGRDLRIRQVAAVVDETGYTVTLTSLPQAREEAIDGLDQVMSSWRWN